MALTVLRITEEKFWSMRPITFLALIDAHARRTSTDETEQRPRRKEQPQEVSIDEISWW